MAMRCHILGIYNVLQGGTIYPIIYWASFIPTHSLRKASELLIGPGHPAHPLSSGNPFRKNYQHSETVSIPEPWGGSIASIKTFKTLKKKLLLLHCNTWMLQQTKGFKEKKVNVLPDSFSEISLYYLLKTMPFCLNHNSISVSLQY